VDPAAAAVFHLHHMDEPVLDPQGFVHVSSAGTKLFGTATGGFWTKTVLNPTEPWPSWRTDLTPDEAGEFLVALETAPAGQGARTVAPFVPLSKSLRGAVLGNAMVAFVTGPVPLTYPSPVTGMHTLIGLQPNTRYTTPGTVSTASPAGLLRFMGSAVGTPITIAEAGITPPPAPVITGCAPNPVVAGQPFGLSGRNFTPDARATFNAYDCQAHYVNPQLLSCLAPRPLALPWTAPVNISQQNGGAQSPALLTITAPAPPPRVFALTVTLPAAGPPTVTIAETPPLSPVRESEGG